MQKTRAGAGRNVSMRLLLAEDERELVNALAAILKREHYSVDAVYHGEDALDYALGGDYDAIVMDIMMPRLDGLTVLKRLRDSGVSTPVLLLTAKSEVGDRILGLDTGADDYLTKPFSMGELLARLRAMTRRKGEFAPNIVRLGDLALNRVTFELSCRDERFRLGNKEFQIMLMLLTNPGQPISADRFMEKIWGYDAEAEINVVWVYVSYLRKKLAALRSKAQIKAIRGVGYLLEIGGENG